MTVTHLDKISYEEGLWTPELTSDSPGDLSVSYAQQIGQYTKVGRLVTVSWIVNTSTFQHTTASGNCRISGLPFVVNVAGIYVGNISWSGIAMEGFTDMHARPLAGTNYVLIQASACSTPYAIVTIDNLPSGEQIILRGTITYEEQG